MPNDKKEDLENKELTIEEYESLSRSIEEFQNSFLSFLAGTSQYEVVPTTDELGNPISQENLELIRRECLRLGLKVLYSLDNGKNILVVNPENMKTGIVSHIVEMH